MSMYQKLSGTQVRRANWQGSWGKSLDRMIPRSAEFPFSFEFFVKRFSTIARSTPQSGRLYLKTGLDSFNAICCRSQLNLDSKASLAIRDACAL